MSLQSSVMLVLHLVHFAFVLKLYQINHQLYAALLGLFVWSPKMNVRDKLFNDKAVKWYIKPQKLLNGSCKIKIKNSCMQTGSHKRT